MRNWFSSIDIDPTLTTPCQIPSTIQMYFGEFFFLAYPVNNGKKISLPGQTFFSEEVTLLINKAKYLKKSCLRILWYISLV